MSKSLQHIGHDEGWGSKLGQDHFMAPWPLWHSEFKCDLVTFTLFLISVFDKLAQRFLLSSLEPADSIHISCLEGELKNVLCWWSFAFRASATASQSSRHPLSNSSSLKLSKQKWLLPLPPQPPPTLSFFIESLRSKMNPVALLEIYSKLLGSILQPAFSPLDLFSKLSKDMFCSLVVCMDTRAYPSSLSLPYTP